MLLNLSPEKSILRRLPLSAILNYLFKFSSFRAKHLLCGPCLTLNNACESFEGTLPLVTLFVFLIFSWLSYHKDGVEYLLVTCLWKRSAQIAKDLQFLTNSVDLSVLKDPIKTVAHDGDQHIQHSEL